MARTCGDCQVCCFMYTVSAIRKEAHTPCPEACESGCRLYASPHRPRLCVTYQCGWLRGVGFAGDRPDLSGVLYQVNEKLRGEKFTWPIVTELRQDALFGKGRSLVKRVVTLNAHPVIIVDCDALPPDDKGDRVIVKEELAPRSRRLMGKFVDYLDEDRSMGVYELVREG